MPSAGDQAKTQGGSVFPSTNIICKETVLEIDSSQKMDEISPPTVIEVEGAQP